MRFLGHPERVGSSKGFTSDPMVGSEVGVVPSTSLRPHWKSWFLEKSSPNGRTIQQGMGREREDEWPNYSGLENIAILPRPVMTNVVDESMSTSDLT